MEFSASGGIRSVLAEGKKDNWCCLGCAAILLALIFLVFAYFGGLGNYKMQNDRPPANVYSPQLTYPSPSDNSSQQNPESQEAKDCLKEYIKSVAPNSPLIDKVDAFVTAGKKYNVNPALMLAIAQQETNFATTGIAKENTYDYFGTTACSDGFRSFASWEDAINFQANYIHTEYLKKGFDSVEKMGGKYCPTNANWGTGVTQNLNAITSKCPEYAGLTNSGGCVNGYRKPIVIIQSNHDVCTLMSANMALNSLGYNLRTESEMIQMNGGSHKASPLKWSSKDVKVTSTQLWSVAKQALSEGKPVVYGNSVHYTTLWGAYDNNTFGAFDSNYATPRNYPSGINVHKEYRVTESQIINTSFYHRGNLEGYFIFERNTNSSIRPCQATQQNQNNDDCSSKTPNKNGMTWIQVVTGDNQKKCVEIKNNTQVINAVKQVFANISGFTINDVEGYGARNYNSYHPTGCAIDINKSHNPYFVNGKATVVTGEIPYTPIYSTKSAFIQAQSKGTDKLIIPNGVIKAITQKTENGKTKSSGISHPLGTNDWQHFQINVGGCSAGQ